MFLATEHSRKFLPPAGISEGSGLVDLDVCVCVCAHIRTALFFHPNEEGSSLLPTGSFHGLCGSCLRTGDFRWLLVKQEGELQLFISHKDDNSFYGFC